MENTVVVQFLKYRGKFNNKRTWVEQPKKVEKNVLRSTIAKG